MIISNDSNFDFDRIIEKYVIYDWSHPSNHNVLNYLFRISETCCMLSLIVLIARLNMYVRGKESFIYDYNVIYCNDIHCNNVVHRAQINEMCSTIISICLSASAKTIPRARSQCKIIPGWNQYHYAVRRAKRRTTETIITKLAENMTNSKDFWAEIKTIDPVSKLFSNTIDQAVGSDEVSEIFLTRYKALFNSGFMLLCMIMLSLIKELTLISFNDVF